VFFGYAAHPSAGIIRIRSFGSDCASLSALRLPVISTNNPTTMEVEMPFFVKLIANEVAKDPETVKKTG
jgi:hypothetical protein